jgi:NAD(P)H dehydrogenase (quinone)
MVTGATGNLGSLVVEELLKLVPVEQVAVSVRDPKKAEHLVTRGVDVRTANFNDYESLLKAFDGIDRLLIISTDDIPNRVAQQTAAVNAAKEKNVGFIAYTSAPNATESKLALAESHKKTEEAIQQSGIPYAILRNNWYLENEMGTFQTVLNGGPWVIASGQGKVGWAPRRDYAEAAAKVLAGGGSENTVYELGGKLLTQEELSAVFASATGKTVQVQYVDQETYSNILQQAGLPGPVADMLAAMQTLISEGVLEVESNDLEQLLGHPPTPLEDAIRSLLK